MPSLDSPSWNQAGLRHEMATLSDMINDVDPSAADTYFGRQFQHMSQDERS
jgi:hypothetical protein